MPGLGGEIDELGAMHAGGETPQAALAAFLGPSNMFASLPTAGYTLLHEEGHWASFVHVHGGLKTIIVLSDDTELGPGWAVVGLRACDASEFDPAVPLTFPVTIWTDVNGDPVSTELVRSNPGPEHCGWHLAIFLNVDDGLFFRDPEGVMSQWTTTTFAIVDSIPATAVDSGYRSGDTVLWLDPGADAYVVTDERIERWPRSTDPIIACA